MLFLTSHAQVDSIASFKTTSYSFGKIKQNIPAVTEFSFVNKGDKPLIIEVATAECGCTTPDYPKTPIQKEEKQE